ncbi:MAG: hypothetical protein ACRCU3_03070 [Eubacteriaceae bacterium]
MEWDTKFIEKQYLIRRFTNQRNDGYQAGKKKAKKKKLTGRKKQVAIAQSVGWHVGLGVLPTGKATRVIKVAGKALKAAKSTKKLAKTTYKTSKTIKKLDNGSKAWLNKGKKEHSVYFGMKEGKVNYVGITKQKLETRRGQHNRNGKGFSKLVPQHKGLTRNQARPVEQQYINTGKYKGNKINSVAPKNKHYPGAMNWAKKFLRR